MQPFPASVNVYRLEFPLSPPTLILYVSDFARPFWRRRTENLKETETLAQTRDTLLPKLISGEVRVDGVSGLQETAK